MVVSHEGGVRTGKGEVADKFRGEVGDGSFWLGAHKAASDCQLGAGLRMFGKIRNGCPP